MNVAVRALDPASPADREALLALTRRCDTGTTRFRVDRAPDPFALGRHFGPTMTWGAFVDGRLAGSAAISAQSRAVAGKDVALDYLHDLRVDPELRRAGVTRGLGEALAAHRARPGASAWAFGTVLGDNLLAEAIVRGTGAWVGAPERLGETAHVVAPPVASPEVAVELAPAAWRELHAQWAPCGGYAPADPRWFDGPGHHLAYVRDGRVEAVALLCDEEPRRRLLVAGARVALGYLASLAPADPPAEALAAFVSAAAGRYDLVAYGLDAAEARRRGLTPALTSTTWTFGRPAAPDPLAFHELTLI